jgi:SCP-2 sterol transfer family
MAEQPQLSDDVTPEQFFESLLPMGFAAQEQEGNAPRNFTIHFNVAGEGGGDWMVHIADGKMDVAKGAGEANLSVRVGLDDWRDAVLGRDGADLSFLLPQGRPGRPDNSERASKLKGTMALELSREAMGKDPFKMEMSFGQSPTPRTVLKMKIEDYADMQTGKLNGQQAFMAGRLRVEGDMGFLMQIATLTM